ncbi:acrylyl-CoA reductase family protein [Alicyclobacillus sp. ALC3]|uniref:acrylyl-CoA reductase family protein n=1 Tax=Alicyclobacillus sp. ALC3 TaxID=2796143 RepID=UPI0023780AA1|nr:acryloyl-CoA reductase [Alicyclobacillus sp. ALC3]WDL95768.1 acryloyl-CoA reductase [Alicyclobacillus sp. ALC3]
MNQIPERFRALLAVSENDEVRLELRELAAADLPQHEVVIQVAYSSVNYKDGLASIKQGRVVRTYPIVPGIDLAGTVVWSEDSAIKVGTQVLVTGYELGVSQFGGYAEYASVPASWVIPLPRGLSAFDAMVLGTAGFTAALSVERLLLNGLQKGQGPVLVTGASGGVGSVAVAILAKSGYSVVASTGKQTAHELLRTLGASDVIGRDEVLVPVGKSLDQQRWAGAVDPVGGQTLSSVLRSLRYGASVSACGLTGGPNLEATVFPFILRGVNLLGIDSVYAARELRMGLWRKLATDWNVTKQLAGMTRVVGLEEVPTVLKEILNNQVQGRVVVQLQK